MVIPFVGAVIIVYVDVASRRPLLEKLGVKPGQRVSVIRLGALGFIESLRDRGADVSSRLRRDSDQIFFAVNNLADLERLRVLRDYIKPNGSIWVIRTKGGGAALKETDVIDAGLRARMVDNKIVAFSETQGAMRLVTRLVDR
jgi:hypothetical protein